MFNPKIFSNKVSFFTLIIFAVASCQAYATAQYQLNTAIGYGELNPQSIYLNDVNTQNNTYDSQRELSTQIVGFELKYRKSRDFTFYTDSYVINEKVFKFNDTQFNSEHESNFKVNELYASYRFNNQTKLTVGRKRFLWGHGFSYIPSDFVNPPLDPTSLDLTNNKGVDSISADYFSGNSAYSFMLNLDDATENGGFGLKYTNSDISDVDWNLIYYYSDETEHALGFSFSSFPLSWMGLENKSLTLMANLAYKGASQYRVLTRETFSQTGDNFAGIYGVKGEGAYQNQLVSLSYDLSDYRMIIRAEYYKIDEAYRENELQYIYSSLESPTSLPYLLSAEWLSHLSYGRNQRYYSALSISQDTLFEASGNRFLDTFSYSFDILRGKDKSTMYNLRLTSLYFNTTNIGVNILVPKGDANTEFGSMPYKWNLDLVVAYNF
ncbi:hypothetical protein [Aliikangiella maris]|uniref:Uncharacterized protein n=2 Tax=Aliikangiella maris TaxID=3162458 RepID=A0ABV2BUD7_9GAMM